MLDLNKSGDFQSWNIIDVLFKRLSPTFTDTINLNVTGISRKEFQSDAANLALANDASGKKPQMIYGVSCLNADL